jgi:hypothetical protein
MATPERQSAVSILTYANGDADVTVTGKGGTLTLTVSPDGPTISIPDLERTKRLGGAEKYNAVFALEANGHLRGWFVEKKGATARDDTLMWFPARKTRAKKRPTQKRTTPP